MRPPDCNRACVVRANTVWPPRLSLRCHVRAVPTDPADRAPRTLYLARGWSEVEAFLFGCPQRFNLYRNTSAPAPAETLTANVRCP